MYSKLHVKPFAELLSYSYVPQTGKLIFGKKVLPKMGHATIPGVGGFMSQKQGNSFSEKRFCPKWDMQRSPRSGVLCPKNRETHFRKKGFAQNGTCNRGFSPKIAKNGSNMNQNAPNLQNYLCGCPFLEHSYFENKYFDHFGTCHKMRIFNTFGVHENSDT
jgi:hypothetical protein